MVHYLRHIHSGKGKVVFKSSWSSKQGMIGLITFIVVENSKYSFAGNVIFFQTSIYLVHVFDRGSEFILLMEPFCLKVNHSFESLFQS